MTDSRKISYMPGTFLADFVLATRPYPPGKFGEELPFITPTEILSREHAIIERVMIAMESMVARLIDNPGIDVYPINHAAITLNEFDAMHHMVDEEKFLFPKFREAGVAIPLVDTLQAQHDRGRVMIGRIIDLTRERQVGDVNQAAELADLCISFIIMYRAHIAREETVAFPALYDIVPRNYVDNIGRQMRDEERGMMNDAGLRKLMDNLAKIEEAAGTADLSLFTP